MSKRPKEVYGKKLIYHYSAPVMFTLLFSLMAIAVYVLIFFLPYINGEVVLNGQHFIFYAINLFKGGDNVEINYYVDSIIANVFDGAAWLNPIIKIMLYFIDFSLLVMGIFAFILAIGSLVMIFSGRLRHWKLPHVCILWMLLTSIPYFGTMIFVNIFALIKAVPVYDTLYVYIFFGTLFALTIAVHIIYANAFKNHVYVKNERTLNIYIAEYEKENMVVDTSKRSEDDDVVIEEAPKIVMVPLEDQTQKNDSSDNRKKLPRGLKHIGGHAFSQNTALEEADIPLGIEVLGAGAFANCVNLKVVHIPESVKKIEYNCFFNCIRLERITYGGSREMWKRVKRGSNWLTAAGTKFVVCRDGALAVDPEK